MSFSSITTPPPSSALRHSTGPPSEVEASPRTPLPPLVGFTRGTSRTHPNHSANTNPGQPRRTQLDPEIAASVARAKKRTGKSWRWLAKRLGISHSHLLQISQGVRCPSRTVALAMKPLFGDEEEWHALVEAAVIGRGRDRTASRLR